MFDKNKWDNRRQRLEAGEGGDHDQPFEYHDPTDKLPQDRLHALVTTMWLALHGLLGGKDDGEEDAG